MPRAVGHRDAYTSWHQDAAQLTEGCFPVGSVVEHVQRQHDVKRAVLTGNAATSALSSAGQAVRSIPSTDHTRPRAPARRASTQVLTVAAAGIQHPRPGESPARSSTHATTSKYGS